MAIEREVVLQTEREKLAKEVADSLAHREIQAENQRKIEVYIIYILVWFGLVLVIFC
jgi:hypothetical protein